MIKLPNRSRHAPAVSDVLVLQCLTKEDVRWLGGLDSGEGCKKEKKKRSHGVLDFFLTMLPLRLVSVPWSMMGEGVRFP